MKSAKELIEVIKTPIFIVKPDLSVIKSESKNCAPYLYDFYFDKVLGMSIYPKIYDSFSEWRENYRIDYIMFTNEPAAQECAQYLINQRIGLLKENLVGKTIKTVEPLSVEDGFKLIFNDGIIAEIFWPNINILDDKLNVVITNELGMILYEKKIG